MSELCATPRGRSDEPGRLQLLAKHGNRGAIRELVVLELLRLVRDYTDWKTTLEYIDGLPERLAKHPLILEQRALALAKSGDDVPKAAAALEALIEDHGATAERLGLLGGRHKQLLKAATDGRERPRHHLEQAIGGYERGMKLDPNDFYCSGNLPRLYRRRGKTGDEQRAAATVSVAMIACHAAIERDPHNEWAWATLLGTAFDAGDVDEAGRLRDEIESRNTADSATQSMFDDLQTSLEQQEDASVRPVSAPLWTTWSRCSRIARADSDTAGACQVPIVLTERREATAGAIHCGVVHVLGVDRIDQVCRSVALEDREHVFVLGVVRLGRRLV